jgi:hypothetical protein
MLSNTDRLCGRTNRQTIAGNFVARCDITPRDFVAQFQVSRQHSGHAFYQQIGIRSYALTAHQYIVGGV